MSMIDLDGPIVTKLEQDEFKRFNNLNEFNGVYWGYVAFVRKGETKPSIRKVFIDEICYVKDNMNRELIDTICSVSFYYQKKRLFGFMKSKTMKAVLDKPIYSGGMMAFYSPEDKISIEDIFLHEETCLSDTKNINKYNDILR